MNDEKKILQTPKGMKPISQNMRPEDAYVAAIGNLSVAISSLVDRMSGIEEKLDEIGGELSVLSRYAQRKGEAEGTWKPDDIEFLTGGEDAGSPTD